MGAIVFFSVYGWPVVISPVFMLFWGWIGWLPALAASYFSGSFAAKKLLSIVGLGKP